MYDADVRTKAVAWDPEASERHARVPLVPHDASWSTAFDLVAREIEQSFPDQIVAIHHIGSTAIPTVAWAKPIVDILVEAKRIDVLNEPAMTARGFEARGEYGIAGRRYFVRPAAAGRVAVHVHVYERTHFRVLGHLAFRDHLRAHPAAAREYAELKFSLASMRGTNRRSYQDRKAYFIAQITAAECGG